MRKRIYALLILSITSCKGQESNKTSDYKFSPENFNFTLDFQEKPAETQTETQHYFGSIKINQAFLEDKEKQMGFVVNYMNYKKENLDRMKPSLKEFYDFNEKQGAKQVSGEIIYSKSFTIDGLEGREVKTSMRDGELLMTSRMLLNGTEYYIWSVSYLKTNEWNKRKTDFLNGLKIKSKTYQK